jgi:hypothetical protein
MKFGDDHRITPSACLHCGKVLDEATCVDRDALPEAGAATICISCGHIMVFADDMSLRDPSNEEMIEIAADPRILAVQHARAMLERNRAECEDFVRTLAADKPKREPGTRGLTDAEVNALVDAFDDAIRKRAQR